MKDKKNNMVVYDPETWEKAKKEIPRMKLITVAVLSEKLKIGGSLARRTIQQMEADKLITRVVHHHTMNIYSRAKEEKAEEVVVAAEVGPKKKKGEKGEGCGEGGRKRSKSLQEAPEEFLPKLLSKLSMLDIGHSELVPILMDFGTRSCCSLSADLVSIVTLCCFFAL